MVRGRVRVTARASNAKPRPKGGVPCGARSHGLVANSLRELTFAPFRQVRRSQNWRRAARAGPGPCAPRLRTGALAATRPRPCPHWRSTKQPRCTQLCICQRREDQCSVRPRMAGKRIREVQEEPGLSRPGGGHGRIRLPVSLGSRKRSNGRHQQAINERWLCARSRRSRRVPKGFQSRRAWNSAPASTPLRYRPTKCS